MRVSLRQALAEDGQPNRKVVALLAYADPTRYLPGPLNPEARQGRGIQASLPVGPGDAASSLTDSPDCFLALLDCAPRSRRRAEIRIQAETAVRTSSSPPTAPPKAMNSGTSMSS